MTILTAGCSFTKYKWACWPNFVKWYEPGHNIINLGRSANSNETIARSVYNAVMKYKEIKKIYIMWSGADRYEIVVDKKPEKSSEDVTWSSYNPDFRWYQYHGGHVETEKHRYYQKHFLNERQNQIRLLEKIVMTQMFLDKHKIEYKMMCFMGNILLHNEDTMSNGQRALYKNIDWSNFIFYKDKLGLFEFANQEYPNEYAEKSDNHPLPLTHYKWVKDIMYKSKIETTDIELKKLINFKKDRLK